MLPLPWTIDWEQGMLGTEIVIRFRWVSVAKVLLFSPAVAVPICLLFYLPWESANAPAWVQAIGSIAAIIAAWLIPYQHEKMRVRKQKEDLLASVAWLALRVKNSFDHMVGVIQKSEPKARDRWLFLSQPSDWAIHRDAAREFPLVGFTRDEISWLLCIRSVTEFGLLCAEDLRTWDFDNRPDLTQDFPHNDGITFHGSQITWALGQLPLGAPRRDAA